jgi:hypothetical protein
LKTNLVHNSNSDISTYLVANKNTFEAFQINLDLLMEKAPKIGLFAHTFPCTYQFFYTSSNELNAQKDEKMIYLEEAISEEVLHWKKQINLENKDAIYIYGIGLGYDYLALKNWLKLDEKRDLIFLEDDEEIFSVFLHTELATEILKDPQVHFYFFHDNEKKHDAILDLIDTFPINNIDVVLPTCHHIKNERKFQNLRLHILRKSFLTNAIFNDRINSQVPFQNFLENTSKIPESFYANNLKNSFKNIPAIICGAGPSLEKSIQPLKELEDRALIFAGGSTITALSREGVMPHLGMALDPTEEEYDRLKNNLAFEVPILYSTRVYPKVFETLNGPLGYMRAGIGGVPELWLEEELNLQGELIGNTVHEEALSVTTLCIAMAKFMGCNPIILTGCDLSYSENRRYAKGVIADELNGLPKEELIKKKDIFGKYVNTTVQWIMESTAISEFAQASSDCQFFNATEGGLGFNCIPNKSLSDLSQEFLQKKYDLRSWLHSEIESNNYPLAMKEEITHLLHKLSQSIDNCEVYTKIIIEEFEKAKTDSYQSGRMVLAEMDLKEEDAYCYLFYDLFHYLEKLFQRTYKNKIYENDWKANKIKWEWFHEKVKEYAHIIHNFLDHNS